MSNDLLFRMHSTIVIIVTGQAKIGSIRCHSTKQLNLEEKRERSSM
jgi:hypothetical protein